MQYLHVCTSELIPRQYFSTRQGVLLGFQGHTQLANPKAKPIQTQISSAPHFCSEQLG